MTDTLSDLAREIGTLIHDQSHTATDALHLAERLETFAADHPGLSPDTRVNLLTQLARTVDRTCPRDPDTALALLVEAGGPCPRCGEADADHDVAPGGLICPPPQK